MEVQTHEFAKYSRQMLLPEIGIAGQQRLANGKVAVIGCGGLGSAILPYLAGAGVGTIGLVDLDLVAANNLHRQVLYTTHDIGRPKAEIAARRLRAINPDVEVRVHPVMISSENALELLEDYDIVIDGSDNFPTRYLVNDACYLLNKTLVYGSIFRFEGQVSVFNAPLPNGEVSPNYRDLFPQPPAPESVPNCAEGGVIGVLPGIIGSMQANEAIKLLAKIGEPLAGKLYILDAKDFSSRLIRFGKDPQNPLSGSSPSQTTLVDYDAFCGLGTEIAPLAEDEVSVEDLYSLIQNKQPYTLLDVRTPYEYQMVNLGGTLISAKSFDESLLQSRTPIIVHCRTGKRSLAFVKQLKKTYPQANILSLKGGIVGYTQKYHPEVEV